MIYFLKLIALELGFIVLIGLAYLILVAVAMNIAWCIDQVKKKWRIIYAGHKGRAKRENTLAKGQGIHGEKSGSEDRKDQY